MKRLFPALLLGISPVHSAEEAASADLLRFTNGNRLDGHFGGLKEGPAVVWKRDDVDAPVDFKVTQLRQVVLRSARPAKPLPDLSSVSLVNGDRIPGTITAMDAHEVSIDTVFAGPLVIPRASVSMISPNPLGGKLLFNGPFSEEGWNLTAPEQEEPPAVKANGNRKDADHADDPPEEKKLPAWSYSSGAWYHRQGATALTRDVHMPDRAMVRFQIAWKSRLALAIAFHADLKKPDKAADDAKNGQGRPDNGPGLPMMFGNAYVMNLYPGYVILNRCGYDDNGKPVLERIQSSATNARLPESGEATVEIRCNRKNGEIALFINDEFAAQWTEGTGEGDDGYAGRGGAIGFQVQTLSAPGQMANAPVRISDLVVAEWNGMPDAARSLQTNDMDIVLLSNGTDRFSGEVTGLAKGKLQLKGRYGAVEFPMDDVAEVRFARNRLAKAQEPTSNQVQVRFLPFGRLSGATKEGTGSSLILTSPVVGKTKVDLDYAVMLDFKNSNSFLDDWDAQF
ncbi:hypothetical protein [Luteolibacter sp. LG18]|uniref:hypothetical protein n=1 Tax=Luteolibacter sp. LG18 TaxID=2819286 RepID=UPI002B300C68|nr:hypothetical protein llg_02430 [Luteolibacter sp. LG18]